MLRRIPIAALAGVLLSLAYEPVAIPYVMPLALAGFALCTRGLRARAGFGVGLAFGIGFYFVHIYWMRASIGTDAWLSLSSTEAFFYGVLGSLVTVLHRLRAWPFWLAAAWTTIEMVRSTWPFSGMPWGRLGFGVVDTPMAPALAYVGVNGVTFLVAALGFLLARLVLAAPGDERLLAGVSVVGLASVSVLASVLPWTLETSGQTTVAAIQGDVPGAGNNVLFDTYQLTQNHVDATVELAEDVAAGRRPQPDFVVWPENSTASDPFVNASVNAQIQEALAAIDVPIMVGAIVDDGPDHILNEGIVWDPVTGPGERYAKRNPVPYGEYIPLRSHMPSWFLTAGRLGEIGRDMRAGTRSTPLVVAGVPVADSICFDIGYDDGLATQQENGAELLTVQTSNASFIFTDQVEQQFAITRARAIESGKYVVVAATNGIAGVIAPDGSVVDRSQRLTRDIIVETVDLRTGVTPGVRVGRVLPLLTAALSAVGLLLGLLTYHREPTGGTTARPRRSRRRVTRADANTRS